MPNWCDNSLTISHTDARQIDRVVEAFKRGELFKEFVPCPPELLEHDAPMRSADERTERFMEQYGAKDWYDWCVSNWGTKWDINADDTDVQASADGRTVSIYFQTAWAPPVVFYATMADDLGFEIDAHYLELGMSFVGRYTNSEGDQSYEFSTKDDLGRIPQDIRERWDLDEIVDAWDDEEYSEDAEQENRAES